MKKLLFCVTAILMFAFITGCISLCPVPIDEHPDIKIDDNLVGIWKMREDTNVHDYFVVENDGPDSYSVCYMNKGGDNRVFEHYPAYFSEIRGHKFLNVFYRDFDHKEGYMFFKIESIDHNGFEMTAAAYIDGALEHMSKPEEVRARIALNIDNPAFYQKTLHFRKKLPLKVCK